MYDYRSMTPEERLAVVAHRRERGFPPHKPPHLHQGGGWYFISAATYEHKRHFSAPRELTALERRLLEAFVAAFVPCAGWVVFPNHYHALVYTQDLASLGRTIGRVHGRSAFYANLRDGRAGRRVWYKFRDRKIRSEGHYWACLHYIVSNPVKHQYAQTITSWPWSCVHELIKQYGEAWIDDLLRSYPVAEFGASWDVFDCERS